MIKENGMSKKALLINDFPGYGKVALAAMMPILTHMGINTFNLPTALVSNTLDYGKFEILDTTSYMENTLHVWDELNFTFDAISTGFIVSKKQVDLVWQYCQQKASEGVTVFCDPIMGDEGHLYNGITVETVNSMQKLCGVADYIIPNYTEACYLAGLPCKNEALTTEEINTLIQGLKKLGAKSIIITSTLVKKENKQVHAVVVYDSRLNTMDILPFTYIPVRFPGTGDAFSSIMMGKILQGNTLVESVTVAMEIVYKLISSNLDSQDTFKGIPLESCLHLLDEY